ncbi:PadR family transcriptional regulator [Streptomyces sp. NPDC096068]|uniref:PadR family transcriptional regulator n=1 Tax=Streptomyces sp. NPDC096068 TaxID=3155424 RepID=UPI0033214E7C
MRSSQLLKGALELAVLLALDRRESYGLELVERLRDAGLRDVADPSVYGVLRRLEKDGMLTSSLVPSTAGPARKYYELSGAGREALAEANGEWARLAGAIERLADRGDRADRTEGNPE